MKKEEAEKELKPYEQDKLAKVPSWIKILLLKYWAAAAAFYFFGIGGGALWGNDTEKLMLVMILGVTLFNNFFVRLIVRFMKNSRDDTFRYNMVNTTGTKSFFINLVYSTIIIVPLVIMVEYLGKHDLLPNILGLGNDAIGPFTFGFIYLLFDTIAVTLKNLIVYLYRKRAFKNNN